MKKEAIVLANIFVQNYILKKGIEKFGEKGKQLAKEEMKQLHDRKHFYPIKMDQSLHEDKVKALALFIFITDKKDGRVKSHTADGSKQRQWMSKDEAAVQQCC